MPHNAKQTAIAEIISRLLSHFATADEPLAVRRAIAEDWLDDLDDLSAAHVAAAAKEWRLTYATRPTIAEIRKLAIAAERENPERLAIADQNKQLRRELDPEMVRLWSRPDNADDHRTWQQRRADALAEQNERFRRGAQWRKDNPNWAARKPMTAGDLGVTARPAPRASDASYPEDPT